MLCAFLHIQIISCTFLVQLLRKINIIFHSLLFVNALCILRYDLSCTSIIIILLCPENSDYKISLRCACNWICYTVHQATDHCTGANSCSACICATSYRTDHTKQNTEVFMYVRNTLQPVSRSLSLYCPSVNPTDAEWHLITWQLLIQRVYWTMSPMQTPCHTGNSCVISKSISRGWYRDISFILLDDDNL